MSTCMNLPRSNRTYPERTCANPLCEHGKIFIPHDRRQLYCCPRCGENAGNDRARELRLTKFSVEKELRDIDKKLGKLYAHYLKDNYCFVHQSIFNHELIDLRLSVEQSTNTITSQQVRWFYEYGVEMHPENKTYFIIYKRKK